MFTVKRVTPEEAQLQETDDPRYAWCVCPVCGSWQRLDWTHSPWWLLDCQQCMAVRRIPKVRWKMGAT